MCRKKQSALSIQPDEIFVWTDQLVCWLSAIIILIYDRKSMANTKSLSREERKKVKRTARKKATPKAKRTAPRGSLKRKVKKLARGTAKR